MKKPKILIIVKGGIIQEVRGSSTAKILIADLDVIDNEIANDKLEAKLSERAPSQFPVECELYAYR